MNIYVTGLGLVTALGYGTAENHRKLSAGISGIGFSKNSGLRSCSLPVGEYPQSNREIAEQLGISPSAEISRTALLGLLAAKQIPFSRKAQAGFINGSTVGGMDRTEIFYREYLLEKKDKNFRYALMHDLGTVTDFIAGKLGVFDHVNTLSTACSSSANAILTGAELIRAGRLDSAIAGGCDALSAFTIEGFNSLMIYDNEPLKPFDQNRKGLNLGEGGGYLRLESRESIQKTGNRPLALLSGWHNANDSYHQTALSPDGDGPQQAIRGALKFAGLDSGSIDCVNAHGTGTGNNDESELTALEAVFETVPPFSSTKSAVGHTLGAAGGVEAVFSVMSILYQTVYPGLNQKTPMKGFASTPVNKAMTGQKIKHVLSNSFGFGGNCTTLIFSAL